MATLGLVTPAVVVATIIFRLLSRFMGNRYVEAAFTGLRPASIALIAAAGLSVSKVALLNVPAWQAGGGLSSLFVWPALILGILIFLGQKFFPKIHPTVWILLSALVGIVLRFAEIG